jgi:hypothetical protein
MRLLARDEVGHANRPTGGGENRERWAGNPCGGYRRKMGISHAMTLMMRSRTLVAMPWRGMQLAAISQLGGLRVVRQQFARRAYEVSGAVRLEFPLIIGGITNSDSVQRNAPSRDSKRGRAPTVGWAMTPPTPGSGGHSTNIRIVQTLEEAGHRCGGHLYDRHQTPVDFHANVIPERNSA